MTETLEDRIIEMMIESTGINMLDSGGTNGRAWQKNQLIKDWDAVPSVDVEVWDDEVIVQYSTYHYLMNFLDITDESERLNDLLREIMDVSENSYMSDMETFLQAEDVNIDSYACHDILNTYNYDNIIDHVLQYAVFEVDGETYIMLQVHTGCDVRSGYSVPQIFAIDEPDYFNLHNLCFAADPVHCENIGVPVYGMRSENFENLIKGYHGTLSRHGKTIVITLPFEHEMVAINAVEYITGHDEHTNHNGKEASK